MPLYIDHLLFCHPVTQDFKVLSQRFVFVSAILTNALELI